jgi:hypothetical protein
VARVGRDRHPLGDAPRHDAAAPVGLDDQFVIPSLDENAVEARRKAGGAQAGQEILGLVLEAQHADVRAYADVRERHAGKPSAAMTS